MPRLPLRVFMLTNPQTCFQTYRDATRIRHTADPLVCCTDPSHTPAILKPGGNVCDCILKIFASTFLHVKAKLLIYLYILHAAGQECPVSDVSLIPTFFLANAETRRFRPRSDMKHAAGRQRRRRTDAGRGGMEARRKGEKHQPHGAAARCSSRKASEASEVLVRFPEER